ncbi:hypothetical protein BCV70DRAFT_73361 [Testicularia cyperi]|uniref:Uncharacterized protein n=1 Tax=Testicularia cyperi TaxID=1882483 RepID=A0A317XSR6_9BASI|nr:hypothetical protein BCV70DRAFT_73361 [Testicularia cyperi]
MANRGASEASDKPARRVVPGAPPPSATKAKKKKGGNAPVKADDATSAALIEKSPGNPGQVAPELKVTAQDLAEQAEKQTAIAVTKALEAKEADANTAIEAKTSHAQDLAVSKPNQSTHTNMGPALKIVRGLIEKKSTQKNASSAQARTAALEEVSQALSQADTPVENAHKGADSDAKSRLVLLLQFLHLFNLFFPNPAMPPSFAPNQSMPAALQMSTGQQVAALGKLFDQLANGPLEGGSGDAIELLERLESGSSDEVLPDVSFQTIRSMILKMTAPPAEQTEEPLIPETGLDGPPKDFVPVSDIAAKAGSAAPAPAPVSFIQASEITDISAAEQPAAAGGKVASAATVTTPAVTSAAAVAAEPKLNWADVDDEDDAFLDETPVFEPISSSVTTAAATPAPATPAPETSSPAVPIEADSGPAKPAPAATPAPGASTSGASHARASAGANGGNKERRGKGANGNSGSGKGGNRRGASAQEPVKPQPKVDEDGFILAESKRSKYLQQKQQQQQQQRGSGRGGSRSGGGRGSAGGRAGNGGSGGQQRAGSRTNAAAESSGK